MSDPGIKRENINTYYVGIDTSTDKPVFTICRAGSGTPPVETAPGLNQFSGRQVLQASTVSERNPDGITFDTRPGDIFYDAHSNAAAAMAELALQDPEVHIRVANDLALTLDGLRRSRHYM